jgi:hypothetical protein
MIYFYLFDLPLDCDDVEWVDASRFSFRICHLI